MHTSGIIFVLLLVASSADAQAIAPCPAMPTAPAPCDEKAIATIGTKPVRLSDLDEETRKKIEHLDTTVAEAKRKAVRTTINDVLVELEAARRGITPGELLYREIRAKVARPSAADIQREIAAHPEKYKGEGINEWAAEVVYFRCLGEREAAFLHQLEERFPVIMRADPAAAPRPEATLATVGNRIVTARDAALQIDTAVALARIDVAEREKDAIEKLQQHGEAVTLNFDVPRRPLQNVELAGAPFRGDRNARVTLVEFGDFQCPPCGQMNEVLEEALAPYGARVRYVFREFPLDFHEFAWKAAEAALAAHAQGKFFPYAKLLFANQKALDVEALKKYARAAGLDGARFDRDLDSGRFAGEVMRDRRTGERAGVVATPAFFINGAWVELASFTTEGLRKAIDEAMARGTP